MEHLFLTEGWIVRCVLLLNHVRLINYLNAQKASIIIEEAEMEAWPPSPTGAYRYQMFHTHLNPSRIILAHESGTPSNNSKAVVYEKRLSRKFPPNPYEFHLKNGIVVAGDAFLKKDLLNPLRPFISVKNYRIGFHRPDDPKAQGPGDSSIFSALSGLDYLILNSDWINHFHKLHPQERPLWFSE